MESFNIQQYIFKFK